MRTPGADTEGRVDINDPRYRLYAHIFNGVTFYDTALLFGSRTRITNQLYRVAQALIWWQLFVIRNRWFFSPLVARRWRIAERESRSREDR